MAGLWIFPGSFDPATRGHEDLIRRAAALCDHLVVAVLINPDKKGFLPLKKRLELLERICADIDNASVESYNGLLADYVRIKQADAVVRGVRSAAEMETELPWAAFNRVRYPAFEAVYLPARPELRDVSSSMVRQLAAFGGDIAPFVPECNVELIKNYLTHRV